MSDSSWPASRLLVLALAFALGCGGRDAPPAEPAAAEPADTTPAAAAPEEVRRYVLVVTSQATDFSAEGTIEEGQLFTVAEDEGEGLGFRPTGIEEKEPGQRLVALDVVLLHGAGTDGRIEEPLTSLLVVEGGTATVDPGDDEGTFTVQVATEGT